VRAFGRTGRCVIITPPPAPSLQRTQLRSALRRAMGDAAEESEFVLVGEPAHEDADAEGSDGSGDGADGSDPGSDEWEEDDSEGSLFGSASDAAESDSDSGGAPADDAVTFVLPGQPRVWLAGSAVQHQQARRALAHGGAPRCVLTALVLCAVRGCARARGGLSHRRRPSAPAGAIRR
jgi:hypothetical protein